MKSILKHGNTLIALIFIGVVVIFILGLTLPEDYRYDRFIFIETLFTGLAFAGVIVTVLLQSKELELQRKELSETRKEFEQQNNTLRKQRFENTLFQLIDTLSNATKNFTFNLNGVETTGAQAIKTYFENLATQLESVRRGIHPTRQLIDLDEETQIQMMRMAYKNSPNTHLVRSIGILFWQVLDFIHSTDQIDDNEKDFYAQILKAIISDYDLRVIFYDYFFSDRPLPEIWLPVQYNVFWRIDKESLLLPSHYEYFQSRIQGMHQNG